MQFATLQLLLCIHLLFTELLSGSFRVLVTFLFGECPSCTVMMTSRRSPPAHGDMMRALTTVPRMPKLNTHFNQNNFNQNKLIRSLKHLKPKLFVCLTLPRTSNQRDSGSDNDEGSEDEAPSATVNMTMATLQSFHGISTRDDGTESVFSCNGHDTQRIRDALKTPCSCGSRCWVPLKLLMSICTAFWALSKGAQDAILWSLQTAGSRKSKYSIEGFLTALKF